MSRHDTLTLTQYEEQVKKGSPKHTEDVVDGIIQMFNSNTHEQTHEPSGIIHIVFNRNVKRIQRNTYYHSILQFLLLTYKDAGFPTIRGAIIKLFIWPSLKIKLKIKSLSEYSSIPIPSFYALEFTLVCMNWVNIHIHNNDQYTELKAALDGLDNSHGIISAPICQFFYYTDDNVSYHIVNNIFGSCLQIYTMLSSVGLSMFTTFSINRLLSSYMSGINCINKKQNIDDDDWYSPDDFISGAEECSLNVENRQEPYKRYNFLKTIHKENRFIQDILEIIQPVSLLSQHASRTPSTMVYSLVRKSPEQLKEERRLRKKMKEQMNQGPESVSRSVNSPKGGKKYRSRRHSTTKRRTKRRRRY